MQVIEIHDPAMRLLATAHDAVGSAGLTALLVLAYFGITALLAYTERNSPRYRNVGNVPFFQNFSTLLDFALLDPILIVLVVRSTGFMVALPAHLESVVAISPSAFASASTRYASLLNSWIPCAVLGVGAAVAYTVYIQSLWAGRKKGSTGGASRNGTYLGVMTMLLIYVILTYFYRAVVTALYVLRVTGDGFALEPSVWARGVELVSRFQSGFGLVAGALAVIIIVFVIHDMWIHKKARRRMRVAAASILLAAVTAFVFLGTLIGVHDSLVRVLDAAANGLSASFRATKDAVPAQELTSLSSLSSWPLRYSDVVVLVVGQTASVFMALFSDEALRLIRKVLRIGTVSQLAPR